MNLDNFKSNWQNQKAPGLSPEERIITLKNQFVDFDTKLDRQNRWIKISFLLGTPFLLAILFYFRNDFGWAFHSTIIGVLILMTIYFRIFLKRKELSDMQNLSQESLSFIDGRISQLEFNKKVTRVYMPIYGIVLTALILTYTHEVGQLMEPYQLNIAYAVTITYIALVMFFGMRRQHQKDKATIDPLLKELREMKDEWKKEEK